MSHEGGFLLLCWRDAVVPPHSLSPPLRGQGQKTTAFGGVCWLVEEQSSCKRIRSVYLVWLWMLTETTTDNTGLHSSPCVFEQTLTRSIHLYFSLAELDLLGLQKTCGMRCKEGAPNRELQLSRVTVIRHTIAFFV